MMGKDKAETIDQPAALDIVAALAAPPVEQEDTPGVFLATLSDTLKALDHVDVDLVGILSDHLLTVTPQSDAVVNAKAAIVALAAKRAAPVEEQADG